VISVGSGSNNFDPGQVSHLWFGFGFGKFPLKISNFSIFFPSDQKKSLWVGPKSTQVKATKIKWEVISVGSGSNNFDPGQVSHLWFGFGFGKFPLKISNFSIFFPSGQKKSLWVGPKSTQVKDGSTSYLLQVKSMLGSGQGPSPEVTDYSSKVAESVTRL